MKSEVTRARIRVAAAKVIERDGAGHLTLEKVAAQADLSKGGLLYHYPSKDALLQGLLDHLLENRAGLIDDFGSAEGVSDASGTYFKLPDLRGRVPVNRDSSDTDFDTLGETGGAKDSTVAPHTHGLSSTNQGAGYLEAVEHSVWDIPDYTVMMKSTSGGAMGESAWGENSNLWKDDTGYENVGSLRYLVSQSNGSYLRIRPTNLSLIHI